MNSRPLRYILHADLDAFYASVEENDHPEIKGKPVVVGGSAEGRGVVASASYEARSFGVRSAMPMRTAMRMCPQAVRMAPRFDRYHQVSEGIMSIFRDLTSLVEPISMDEAYLDISEQIPSVQSVEEVALDLKNRVLQETELVVTIGGGVSKTVAKIASQVAKPDGLLLIKPEEERAFMTSLDVGLLWGVGPKTASILNERGVETIGHLAACDEAWLRQAFGKRGPELIERALGIDNDPVIPNQETKSISAEETLLEDVSSEAFLRKRIEDQVDRVIPRLEEEGVKAKTVFIKLRLSDFTTFTRQTTLPAPTDDSRVVFQVACQLLQKELGQGRRFRLIGVGVSNFQESFQMALLPPA